MARPGDEAAAFTVAAVRAAEAIALTRTPPGALMQLAAAGLAAACARLLHDRRGGVTGRRVVLLVGAGDNGGDALFAGARLARRGAQVTALLLAPTWHEGGFDALRAAGGRVRSAAADTADTAEDLFPGADLVVDGIVGIGGRPGLRGPARRIVEIVDTLRAGSGGPAPLVVAVDLPSGVDADHGTDAAAHVSADVTVTFGVRTSCLLLPPAAAAAGRVELVDIGLGPHLPTHPDVVRLTAVDVARRWPRPTAADDKYRRGVVGVVAGSTDYPGAAVLAVGGALRAGAGMVRYVGPPAAASRVLDRRPEAVLGAGRVSAWVVGPGVDPDGGDGQPEAVVAALDTGLPAVVDAGALALLPRPELYPLAGPRLLLTPHAAELARLLSAWPDGPGPVTADDVRSRPAEYARLAARLTDTTVLLKGAVTLVASPQGRLCSQADAPAWLATAGAGDVLAGIAGTLLAAGLDPFDAGALAALVHGRAARRASGTAPGDPSGERSGGSAAPVASGGTGARRGGRRVAGHRARFPVVPRDVLGRGSSGGPIVAGDVVEALSHTLAELLGD